MYYCFLGGLSTFCFGQGIIGLGDPSGIHLVRIGGILMGLAVLFYLKLKATRLLRRLRE